MAQLMNKIILIIFFFLSTTATFADDQSKESIQELKQIIDALQSQVETQKTQLDSQSETLLQLQKQMQSLMATKNTTGVDFAVGADTHSPEALARTQSAAQKPTDKAPNALSNQSRYDLDSPSGANTSSIPAAAIINVPGTPTSVGVHGMMIFQIMHDTVGIDSNEFDAFLIPIEGAPSDTRYSVNPSRIGISSQTALSWGAINTHASLDLNGDLASPEWRLRQFYGEIINDEKDYSFLAGQAYSTMLDLKSVPETLDFAGPSGYFARRQPLLRFTKMFNHKFILNIATDTPNNTVFLDADAHAKWPDFVMAGSWLTGGKYLDHIRLAGSTRDLRAESLTTGVLDSEFGWSLGLTGKFNLPAFGARDSFKFGVTYGDGYGGSIKSGPYDAAFDPDTSNLEAIGLFTTYGGIQHFWSDTWRSNLVYGYTKADNPDFMGADRLDSTTYVAGNIIWNYWKQVTVGFEYLYGRRENVDGASETSSRFLFSSRWTF